MPILARAASAGTTSPEGHFPPHSHPAALGRDGDKGESERPDEGLGRRRRRQAPSEERNEDALYDGPQRDKGEFGGQEEGRCPTSKNWVSIAS